MLHSLALECGILWAAGLGGWAGERQVGWTKRRKSVLAQLLVILETHGKWKHCANESDGHGLLEELFSRGLLCGLLEAWGLLEEEGLEVDGRLRLGIAYIPKYLYSGLIWLVEE